MRSRVALDRFDFLDDHPEGIQQLRKLIVALAISGKLRSKNEDPIDALELVKLIEDERQAYLQTGVLRKSAGPVLLLPDALPEGFDKTANFVRLGSVARIEKGRTGIAHAEPGPYPLVVTAQGRATCDHFDFDGAAAIVPLVSSAGHGKASLQRLHYQEGKFALGTILAAIFPYAPNRVSARFLFEYLTTFKEELLVAQMIGTANVSLSIGKISDVPVPLVSPSVQRTVDELMALCDRLEAARAQREAARDRLARSCLARLDTPDPETFRDDARFALDALPALTARPDQVKQLRQTILNLAVRGKLVPHEPAESLSLQDSPPSTCQESDAPPLPSTWRWMQIESLCDAIVDCPHSTPKFVDTGVVCLDTNGFKNGALVSAKTRYVSEETYQERVRRLVPQAGDIVFAREGSVGESVIVPDGLRCCLGQRVMLFRPGRNSTPQYFQLALSAPSFLSTLLALHKGIGAKHVNVSDMRVALIPLPPLAEQHRIVAKVDELMALCDRLEGSLKQADEHRRRLLEALLHQALEPAAALEEQAA